MLGELIVVGLLHHDVLGELTLNVANVVVAEDGPSVVPGDHVAVTIRGAGDWERDVTWTPGSTEPLWSPDLDSAVRAAGVSFAYLRRLGDDEGSIAVFIPRSRREPGPSHPFRMSSSSTPTSTSSRRLNRMQLFPMSALGSRSAYASAR